MGDAKKALSGQPQETERTSLLEVACFDWVWQ